MSTERGQMLLEARNIVKKFGGVVALRGVKFQSALPGNCGSRGR